MTYLLDSERAQSLNNTENFSCVEQIEFQILNGVFDEDLYQELCITLLHCINRFDIWCSFLKCGNKSLCK